MATGELQDSVGEIVAVPSPQSLPTFLPADHYGPSRTKDDAGLRSLLMILRGMPAIQERMRAMSADGELETVRRIDALLGELCSSDWEHEDGARISSEDAQKLEEVMTLLGVLERRSAPVLSLLRRAGGALRRTVGL